MAMSAWCGLVMPTKHNKYSLRENLKWHLQGFAILAIGTLLIGFIVWCAMLIAIPTE
jgi:hypothetical protein